MRPEGDTQSDGLGGCGPGQLAVALAPFAGEIVGIDPEPAMLEAAADHAARAGAKVRFIEATSDDLDPALGIFRLVVIGRAFHWMNRTHTLEQLDKFVEASGAVVLFGDRHLDIPGNEWRQPYRELIERSPFRIVHEGVTRPRIGSRTRLSCSIRRSTALSGSR